MRKTVYICYFYLVSLENIKDVQCSIDQSRSGSLSGQERVPKIPRHVNIHNASFS